jgi:hypothetical protein
VPSASGLGTGLHTCVVVANIFNKQFRTADNGCYRSMIALGLTSLHRKKVASYEVFCSVPDVVPLYLLIYSLFNDDFQ